jgi:hypothetical protein
MSLWYFKSTAYGLVLDVLLVGFQSFLGSTLKSAFKNSEMFSLKRRRTDQAARCIAATIFSFSLLGSKYLFLCASENVFI